MGLREGIEGWLREKEDLLNEISIVDSRERLKGQWWNRFEELTFFFFRLRIGWEIR